MAGKLPRNQIARVLAERSLAKGVSTRDLSEHVAAYLLEERRTADLEPLLRDIMKYRANKGIVEVTAVSAFPITDTVRADITAQIKDLYPAAKEIIVSEEIRKDVVGGVRLELPDQQFDLSVRAQLSRLKQLTAVGK